MKIMILDPHILFTAGLASLLKNQADIKIVGAGSPGTDILEQIDICDPDIIIMGGDLYKKDGKGIMNQILSLQPEMVFLILGFGESTELMLDVMRNGAKGYLPIDVSEAALVKSLYAMWRGEVAISRSMTSKIVEEFHRTANVMYESEVDFEILTPREEQVLHFLAMEEPNKEIALKLFISGNTVRIHVSSILKKLNLRNRHEAGELLRRVNTEWSESY